MSKAQARTVKSSRLFENDLLEAATHVHPITPLVMWSPVIAYLLYSSWENFSWGQMAVLALAGLFVWTFAEYVMHRWVFHFEAKSRAGKYLVHLFHGIHHNEPEDATRLVMPPVPAVILSSALFGLFYLFLGPELIRPFFAFFLVGYLCYDYIHYATHHFPCKNRVMKFIKRYHMLHHYQTHDQRYGVSNPFWDFVFNTYPKKKSS